MREHRRVLLCALLAALPCLAASALNLHFKEVPPRDMEIASTVRLAWGAGSPLATYRFKLDAPGDWLGGFRYNLNKWSEWGDVRSITYEDFVLEGPYTFTVECRGDGGQTEKISASFSLHFVMPAVMDEGITIDWAKVGRGRTTRERFELLAGEYHQAYLTWSRVYEGERRALKQSWSSDELVQNFSKIIVGKGNSELLKWADKGVAARVSRILAPKMLYDILRQTGVTLVLIYRNQRTNAAAFKTISSYWAWQGYEALAKQAG